MGLTAPAAPAATDAVLEALAAGALDLDELASCLGIERSALRRRLVGLTLSGAVLAQGDGRFARGAG